MTRPNDEQLLAFLEGRLPEPEQEHLLAQLDRDATLATELRDAARGLAALEPVGTIPAEAGSRSVRVAGTGISPWWAVAAIAATLLVAVPATRWLSMQNGEERPQATLPPLAMAPQPEPGFVLVLHGRWPDAATVAAEERTRRATEYWAWTDSLAGAATLMAAGDLRWEPGTRLGPNGSTVTVADAAVESPDFLVGMFAIRADSYEQAMAIARACPHLRYGGSVSVRRAARGVVTTAIAMADDTGR